MDSVLFQGMVVSRKVFNENSKLGELSRRPYHSDSPVRFLAPVLCQATPRVLPNKLSGSQKVQAINKSLSVPLLFFFPPKKEECCREISFSKWVWSVFLIRLLLCRKDTPSGCQGEFGSARESVLCSGPGSTDMMSSDVPKGQPLVPRRSQAGGETPG